MMAMAAMADHKAVAAEVAKRLNLTTTTLYTYVNGDGTPKAAGQAVLDGAHRPGTAGKTRSRPLSASRHPNATGGRGCRGTLGPAPPPRGAAGPNIPSAVPRWTSTAQLYAVSRATLYRLLRGDLDAGRAQELMDEMRAAGLPT